MKGLSRDTAATAISVQRPAFNPQLRVEFHGATVTSDAGLLLPRELDERLGLGALIERPSPVHLQSLGGLRGHQRRGVAGRGSDVSDAGLA